MTSKSDTQDGAPGEPFNLKSRIIWSSIVMVILIGGFGGWAASAQLASAVVAQGSIVVAGNVKKIQHREGGIVGAINVKNGDSVKAGDILIKLDDTQVRSALGVLRSQISELAGRRARLLAERDGMAAIDFPSMLFDVNESTSTNSNASTQINDEGRSIMLGEQRVFEDNKSTRFSQKEQLLARIEQFKEEIKGLTVQRDAKARELKPVRSELKQVKRLRRNKLATIARVNALDREHERINGSIGGLDAQVARANGQISEVKLQILSIDQKARTDAQKELRAIEAKLTELGNRQRAASDRLRRMVLRAPMDGKVHQLNVHTIGGVVSAAEPLLLLVPQNNKLTVEVRFAATDIDQVKIGQVARIRFSAFNQRTTPEAPGVITEISADVVRDAKSGQSFYMGRLDLTADGEKLIGNRKLLPGMPAEVYITTSTRSAFSYFAKPLTDQYSKIFNEE